jgi:hypothetical protein
MTPILHGKSIGFNHKTVLKGELLIWRTKNQARDQGRVHSRIQFASNESKLVPKKLDPGPSSKVGLSILPSRQPNNLNNLFEIYTD